MGQEKLKVPILLTVEEVASVLSVSRSLVYELVERGKVPHNSQTDLTVWIHDADRIFFGDANRDGEYNSGDLVKVLQSGEYEDAVMGNSTWATGDWNADAEFDTGDLVLALQDGGYELGPRAAVSTVPEPSTIVLLITALVAILLAFAGRKERRSVSAMESCVNSFGQKSNTHHDCCRQISMTVSMHSTNRLPASL